VNDILIRNGLVLPCDGSNRRMIGDVLVRHGRIASIGAAASQHASKGRTLIDATNCAVLPGFVQSHVHLCQTIMRGMAEDLPLLAWLRERIWPLEAAHDDQSLSASTQLSVAELLLSGTTTVLDMGTTHGHDVVFEVCDRMGIRVVGGKAMMDAGRGLPRKLRESTAASLRESDRLCARWHGAANGRIRYAYAPRFILSCSERLLRETSERCTTDGILLHTHAAEHPTERAAVRAAFGRDDIDVLASWGIAGPNVVLAHGVQLTAAQIRRAARLGTSVVHCPSANLKLGSGVAPLRQMLDAGVVVGLGCDGAPCNNNLDAWTELRHAALLARLRSGPSSLTASQALELCALGGARVLHLDNEIGSIEVGKRADLIVVSLEGIHMAPVVDAPTALVMSGKAQDVRHVLVDGRHLVRNGELAGLDLGALRARVDREARKLMDRAGLA